MFARKKCIEPAGRCTTKFPFFLFLSGYCLRTNTIFGVSVHCTMSYVNENYFQASLVSSEVNFSNPRNSKHSLIFFRIPHLGRFV